MNNNTSSKENTGATIEVRVLLGDIWRGIKKFGWICLVLAVLLGGFQFYKSYIRFRPEYTVSATFTVQTENAVISGDNGVSAYSFYYDRETADQLNSVFPYIVGNPILQKQVCNDLEVDNMPANVTSSCVEGTNMITLTANGLDPQLTYDTLLSVIENYSSVAEYIIGRTKLVMINEPILPTRPSNSNAWITSIFFAALIGVVLGLGWILVYAMLRKTIRTKEDINDVLNQHCIGVLPQVVFKKYRREISKNIVVTNPFIGNEFHESLRLLAGAVHTALEKNEKTVMITSTAPGEGKTVVSVNLAVAFAQDEKKVLLVDADLRNSGIQRMISESKVEKQTLVDNKLFTIEHIERLDFDLLRFKPAVDTVQKVMRTARLEEILDTAKVQYDLILIDTPPCGMISDATIIASVADKVIYVVRQDAVIQSNIRSGISSLLDNEISLLGCILNGATSGIGGYGGYYNYSSYYKNYRGGYSYKYGSSKKSKRR